MARAMSDSGPRKPAYDRKSGPFDEWEVRDALRTVHDADRIRKNKSLMAEVQKEADRAAKAASDAAQSIKGGK